MTNERWTFTDRDGRDWEVAELQDVSELRYGDNLVNSITRHIWMCEVGEVSQTIESWKPEPLMTRDQVKVQLQAMLDESAGRG